MAKINTLFSCQQCGSQFPKWHGRCLECGEWNSLVEENTSRLTSTGLTKIKNKLYPAVKAKLTPLLSANEESQDLRFASGYKEIDRVLGGGFVEGSLLLLGGRPGIGKSTLLLQVAYQLAALGKEALYISGEESKSQVAARAQRLGFAHTEKLNFLSTHQLDEVDAALKQKSVDFVVLDSIQTFSSSEIQSAPGSVSQVRGVCHYFLELCKSKNVTALLVGQITKEGSIAGPKLIEHMVDAVFYFDMTSTGAYRVLKSHKNRFGAVNESAVFEMGVRGLAEVVNPSQRFLEERNHSIAGSAVVAHQEGSQIYLTEVQALTSRCYVGYPRRTTQGVDGTRLSVLLAVVERALEISFAELDVYCKVATGAEITEPASDLPLMFALLSAHLNKALPSDVLLMGEVGLGGELRSVSNVNDRIKEACRLGFKKIIVPYWNRTELPPDKNLQAEVIAVQNIKQAYQEALT